MTANYFGGQTVKVRQSHLSFAKNGGGIAGFKSVLGCTDEIPNWLETAGPRSPEYFHTNFKLILLKSHFPESFIRPILKIPDCVKIVGRVM